MVQQTDKVIVAAASVRNDGFIISESLKKQLGVKELVAFIFFKKKIHNMRISLYFTSKFQWFVIVRTAEEVNKAFIIPGPFKNWPDDNELL